MADPKLHTIIPKHPVNRKDFEKGVAWACEFFGMAENIDFGLDPGQEAILSSIVKRLDQLDEELRNE